LRELALVRNFAESPEREAQELQFLNPLGTIYMATLGYAAHSATDEQIDVSTEQCFAFFRTLGTLYRGAGLVLQGNLEGALPLLVESFQAMDCRFLNYHSLLGDGYTRAGHFGEARRALDEGLSVAEKDDSRFQEAELHRLLGELHLAETNDRAVAEHCFLTAIATARRQ
jgi:hypothetical protein